MNERKMPTFDKETIVRRLLKAETRRNKELENEPISLCLAADTVIKLAIECNLINDARG